MDNLLSKIEDINILAWVFNNDIKTEQGKPFNFENFSFMIDPWLDWTPNQGVRKASQCGWSVMTNLKLFYAAKHGIPGTDIKSANVIYTMPTDNDIKSFVPSKTNALIANNPKIMEYMKDENGNKRDVDSIERKKIGNNFVYFKGTKSQTAALAITSDLNIHDEADRSNKEIVNQYESRLTTSRYKGRWIFSNPSAPNMPADLMFLQSDQKHWFIKCEHCGHWQYLDWKKTNEVDFKVSNHCFVDVENACFLCSKCALPISDENRKRGKWVAKHPGRDVSGYWVSHLMYPWISVKELLFTESTKDTGYFRNFVLGLPYVGSNVVVDAQTIVNNIVLDDVHWTRGQVAMGIDNGDVKHYVIGNTEGIFEIGKTESWEEIEMLIHKYDPYFVVDLNPYPNKPKELVTKSRKGFASFYVNDQKNLDIVQWGQGDKRGMVYPNRNKVIDDLINYIFSGRMKFFKAKQYWEEYIAHWETMYRADVEDSLGIVRGLWETSTGMDHYCHATVYYYVAMSRMLTGNGQVLAGSTASTLQQMQSTVGAKTAPVIQGGMMKPNTDYLRSSVKAAQNKQKPSGGGSVSGNM